MLTSKVPIDLDKLRQHTRETIIEACTAGGVSRSVASSGKSTTTYELANWTETSVTYLAGRTDLYEQAIDWCEEQGELSYEVIPSLHRDCPTFRGDQHSRTPSRAPLQQWLIGSEDLLRRDGGHPVHVDGADLPVPR